MKVVSREGEVFDAPTEVALVHRMWATAHVKAASVAEYMAAVAVRSFIQSGVVVRTETCEAFVADLLAAGLLQRMQ